MISNPIVVESLRSVVVPAVLGVVVLLAVWRPFKKDAGSPPAWAGVVALGVAVIVGRGISQSWWNNWPGFWPVDTTRRLWLVILAAIIAGVGSSLAGKSKSLALLPWLLVSVFAAWALSQHKTRLGQWSGAEAVGWIALWSAALFAGAVSLKRFGDASDGRWSALVVATYAGAASATAAICWAAITSQSMGVVSAWCGMLFGLAMLRPGFKLGQAAPLAGLVVQAVLMIAYLNAPQDPPRVALGLALGAPLVFAVRPISEYLRRLPDKPRAVIEAAVAVLLLSLAAYTAHLATSQQRPTDDPAADLYG